MNYLTIEPHGLALIVVIQKLRHSFLAHSQNLVTRSNPLIVVCLEQLCQDVLLDGFSILTNLTLLLSLSRGCKVKPCPIKS